LPSPTAGLQIFHPQTNYKDTAWNNSSLSGRQRPSPTWVKSVALYNGRQRLDFRYTLFATKLARHCNMSRWTTSGLMQCCNLITYSITSGTPLRSGAAFWR
jgi:hypothetical protein